MAIKIDCQICGFENDLGRVFCVHCGKKLEFSRTSLDELAERRQTDWTPVIKRIIGAVVFLVIVVVVAVAFWPLPPSDLQIDPSGVAQIPIKTRQMQDALRAHQSVKVTFNESELNGFLAARAKLRNVRQLVLDLKPGAFTMTAWDDWVPVAAAPGLSNLAIRVSCEWTATLDKGGLVVKGGRFGHLPLPTPLAAFAASQFSVWFDDVLAQTGLVQSLKSVEIDDSKASLVFGP